MSQERVPRPKINLTRTLPHQNEYTIALDNEYKDYAFSEERAPQNKGNWRENVFKCSPETPVAVEVGTGAGIHFAHYAAQNPKRCVVGLELKYKPLIQSIRRAHRATDALGFSRNAAICRYHAFNIDELFAENEINNVFIHFPDPWVTPRKPKNRVVNHRILNWIYKMQRTGSFIEFKTDSREYFLWSLDEIKETPYRIEFQTLNLYKDGGKYFEENFQTTFEKIFVKQGIEINYIKLVKE